MQNVKKPHKLEILKHIFTTCIGSLGFVFSWKWNFGIGLLQVDDQDGEETKHDENPHHGDEKQGEGVHWVVAVDHAMVGVTVSAELPQGRVQGWSFNRAGLAERRVVGDRAGDGERADERSAGDQGDRVDHNQNGAHRIEAHDDETLPFCDASIR